MFLPKVLPKVLRLLTVSAIVFLSLNIGLAQQKLGDLKIVPYVFESSKKERVDAELGRLLVPENRSNPQSKLIELAFVRFKSTSQHPGSPIIYLSGGPGNSGIQQAQGSRFPLFMAMRQIADVIALDQRGTGMSKPNLTCSQPLDFPLDEPLTRDSLLRIYKEQSRACAQRWQSEGVDLRGYNTNESADDLESLRIAIGAPKISLWGISYGTHLGLAAIRRHGQNIDRAILAGIEGPDHTDKLPSNYRKHLEMVNQLVKADADLSKTIPDFMGLVNSVIARLDKEPAVIEVKDPSTRQTVKVIISGFLFRQLLDNLYGTDTLPYSPYIFFSASKGDYSIITYLLFQSRSSIGSAMAFMMDCSSGVSRARYRREQRENGDLLFSDINFPFMEVCEAWGNPDLGKTFRSPIKSKVPVLFISGTLDAKTPPSNAKEIKRGFPKGLHLIIDGATHSDPLFLSSPKIKDAMLEFMNGGRVSTTRITLPPMKFVMRNPLETR
ncbi:MAG TPA: alpha/beta hydrolase [Pyrinomonadaceae bacterium]|nr:alpha/beta hydrolase [Pyrinomonadaceae bacterium]